MPQLPLVLMLLAFLQIDHASPQERVSGILEVPEIFGEYPCARYTPATYDIFDEASEDSPVLGTLEVLRPWFLDDGSPCESIEVGLVDRTTGQAGPVPLREFDYEEPGLIVLERWGDNWFRIRLETGSGWILPRLREGFHAYEDLVRESLAYVPAGWSGELWPMPGAADPTRVPRAWEPYLDRSLTVEVLEERIVDGALWFRIRLDPDYGCGTIPEGPPPVAGWVPGYRPSGSNAVWFSSRGC